MALDADDRSPASSATVGPVKSDVGYSYATACATGETFAIGRLSQITDGSGNTQYCYDRFGNLVRKVQTTNGRAYTVAYAYTKAGQVDLPPLAIPMITDKVRG